MLNEQETVVLRPNKTRRLKEYIRDEANRVVDRPKERYKLDFLLEKIEEKKNNERNALLQLGQNPSNEFLESQLPDFDKLVKGLDKIKLGKDLPGPDGKNKYANILTAYLNKLLEIRVDLDLNDEFDENGVISNFNHVIRDPETFAEVDGDLDQTVSYLIRYPSSEVVKALTEIRDLFFWGFINTDEAINARSIWREKLSRGLLAYFIKAMKNFTRSEIKLRNNVVAIRKWRKNDNLYDENKYYKSKNGNNEEINSNSEATNKIKRYKTILNKLREYTSIFNCEADLRIKGKLKSDEDNGRFDSYKIKKGYIKKLNGVLVDIGDVNSIASLSSGSGDSSSSGSKSTKSFKSLKSLKAKKGVSAAKKKEFLEKNVLKHLNNGIWGDNEVEQTEEEKKKEKELEELQNKMFEDERKKFERAKSKKSFSKSSKSVKSLLDLNDDDENVDWMDKLMGKNNKNNFFDFDMVAKTPKKEVSEDEVLSSDMYSKILEEIVPENLKPSEKNRNKRNKVLLDIIFDQAKKNNSEVIKKIENEEKLLNMAESTGDSEMKKVASIIRKNLAKIFWFTNKNTQNMFSKINDKKDIVKNNLSNIKLATPKRKQFSLKEKDDKTLDEFKKQIKNKRKSSSSSSKSSLLGKKRKSN
jgi:hypothetical protein